MTQRAFIESMPNSLGDNSSSDISAGLKIMAYLHGTRCVGSRFVRAPGLDLTACSHADYADEWNDRLSL